MTTFEMPASDMNIGYMTSVRHGFYVGILVYDDLIVFHRDSCPLIITFQAMFFWLMIEFS